LEDLDIQQNANFAIAQQQVARYQFFVRASKFLLTSSY